MEEEWRFLLIDAKHTFNKMDQTIMLWNIHHEWPSGARFVFNTYKHWVTIIICTNDSKGEILHCNQGVTQ
jgi:hypothetical protein